MLLTLTSTAPDATDLGYLLHKHPDRVQSFESSVGTAHVLYPEATSERCTVALLLEVDPVGLVRGRRGGGDFTLGQYVNDRPYAASSLLAVALGRVFGTALKGRCEARPDLVDVALPLTVHLPAVPCRDGADLAHRLLAPLGWAVDARPVPLDPELPDWGDSRYLELTLTGQLRLADALSHLYVLLPVLDDAKHYWVGTDEVDKLVRAGGSWLADHPERELVTRRYLAHQRAYVTDAVQRLTALDEAPAGGAVSTDDATVGTTEDDAAPPARRVALRRRRLDAVLQALRDVGAARVADVGCGEGALLRELLADPAFTDVTGVDVSASALTAAEQRLGLDRMPDSVRSRLTLRQSSVTYRDATLADRDAVVLMEVVEHVDLERLPDLARTVLGDARPAHVVLTTPNAEYNDLYPDLAAGTMRHPDHRFEWTRAELAAWAAEVGERYGYDVEHRPVGDVDPQRGAPTQLALFTRRPGAPTDE
ncbi:3' terminal RNA ribose 2'-O-methyltransferase Hen1 [Thalassiella azotivora]